MVIWILISALFSTIGTYIDKNIVDGGISKNNYFYYMCLTMIPFSLISIVFEIYTNNFYFTSNIYVILLVILAATFRYIRQKAFVGCYRNLEPFEFKSYLTISLIICFIIDVILKIQTYSNLKLLSILFIIIGLFLTNNIKIDFKKIRKELIIKILSDVTMGYLIFMTLKYCSNGLFILIVNLLLIIIFTPIYKPYKKDNNISKNTMGLIMTQQTFGFIYTYINNYLSSHSVTLSSFTLPVSLLFISIGSFILDRNKKPTLKNLLGILITSLGVLLIKLF